LAELAAEQLIAKPALSATESSFLDGHDARRNAGHRGKYRHCPQHPDDAGAKPLRIREPRIRTEKDLEKYQALFANVEFWKKLGENIRIRLFVTGTVLFTPRQTAGFVTQNLESYDKPRTPHRPRGRMYVERKGSADADVHLHRTAGRVYASTAKR